MKPFVVSPHAADDLNDIWFYLAEQAGERLADQTLRRFVQAFRELAEMPGMGHRRSDLTTRSVDFFLVDPYLIVYQRDLSPLPIHAVLHGARDVRKVLRKLPIS